MVLIWSPIYDFSNSFFQVLSDRTKRAYYIWYYRHFCVTQFFLVL